MDDGQAGAFETIADRDVRVRMRDGVNLATSVYLPGRGGAVAQGRFPTVLARTPYGKDYASARLLPQQFVPFGYAVVVQDVRGRYGSGGRWRPLADDGSDGADLLKWIAAQPWSDGKVGTIGTSYVGGTQHALALAGAPALAAMVPVDAMSNPGRFGMRYAGAFELRWLSWAVSLGNPGINGVAPSGERVEPLRDSAGRWTGKWRLATGEIASPEENPDLKDRIASREAAAARVSGDPAVQDALKAMGERVRAFAKALPLRAGATELANAPEYERWLIEAMTTGEDGPFWDAMGIAVADHADRYQDVPVIHVTGAYDSWAGSVANLNFPILSQAKKSPQRLIFGPWTHGQQALTYAGVAEFGSDAAVDLRALERRWFDRWLRGLPNGAEADPPVRVFVMGGGDGRRTPEGRFFVGGRWREAETWPPEGVREKAFFLHGGGGLSTEPPGSAEPSGYAFDPRRPVPSLGGNVSSQGDLMMAGAQQQRRRLGVWPCDAEGRIEDRDDVLSFQTEPLAEPLEVIGPVTVRLWASSDGPDTDFTAKLVDVWPSNEDIPDGLALNVGDGIVRARYRNSRFQPEPLEPGRAYELTVELYPTAILFAKGHRIRLDISSSNFPRFDVNPNTGGPLGAETGWRIAKNQIFHDPGRPSRLLLPVFAANPG